MNILDPSVPIEGFLYTFGKNRFGGTYCHIVFCVLTGRHFGQYRSKGDEAPLRSGFLDSQLRIEDTGRQVVSGQTLYTLRLYNVANPVNERLLGATGPEEIAAWIKAFTLALEQPVSPSEEISDAAFGEAQPRFPLSSPSSPGSSIHPAARESPLTVRDVFMRAKRPSFHHSATIGSETPPAPSKEAEPNLRPYLEHHPDGIAASKWRLVRRENGLRFFEETRDEVIKYKFYKLPVMKCVGVVKADPSAIFDLVMQYGRDRSQWDTTIDSAEIIETKDGHSDVIFVQLRQEWIWLRKRDLCLSRYWKREEDGSYLIFFKSVEHKSCPPQQGHVRAIIHSGGYIISALKSSEGGKPRSLVEHVLEMDVSGWSSWFGIGLSPYPAFVRDSLLESVAGIRDYFAAQRVSISTTVVKWKIVESDEIMSPKLLPTGQPPTSFLDTDDVDEEFFDADTENFDAHEPLGRYDSIDIAVERPRDNQPDYLTGDWPAKLSQGIVDWTKFQGTVQKGPLLHGLDCWSEPDGSLYLVRGKAFLEDGIKVPAGDSLCKVVAVDWLQSTERVIHVGRRPQNIVQRLARHYGAQSPYIFVINLQVPGATHYSLVYYLAVKYEIKEGSLLRRFIDGDDVFRNSRITMTPAVPEGSWIVKQAAGSRAVPLGQIMEVNYFTGSNYFEVDINMGSSSVVRGVMGMVFGYITNLVVDMAFMIKADTAEELPEQLLGVVRCSHLSLGSAREPMPEA